MDALQNNSEPSPDGATAASIGAAVEAQVTKLRRQGRRVRVVIRTGAVVAAGALVLVAGTLSTQVAGGDPLLPLGLVLMAALAFANGSNDVSKAIATLVGSGVTDYRRAIAWGALCTTLGALCSALVTSALLATFTTGFLAAGVRETTIVALAVVAGALLWVLVATRTGLPVSTTHAITGALVVVGAYAYGPENVRWSSLLGKVALPLAVSPFLALALALVAYLAIRVLLFWLPRRAMNGLHWLSSGTASFARGLNDTPKIVALSVAFFLTSAHGTPDLAPRWLFALAAVAMGAGSYLGGLKVTQTLAAKVTRMDHREGFAANVTTATLVAVASQLGLPVSTTHVSSGAIIGIGLREGVGRVGWRAVRDMVLAWVVTLPAAGLLGLATYNLLALIFVPGPLP